MVLQDVLSICIPQPTWAHSTVYALITSYKDTCHVCTTPRDTGDIYPEVSAMTAAQGTHP